MDQQQRGGGNGGDGRAVVVVGGGEGQGPDPLPPVGNPLPSSSMPAASAAAPAPPPPSVIMLPSPAITYPVTYQAMLLYKDHPLRMRLEWDEIHRAEEIKELFEGTAGLDNLSDFWYAQYALICKDNQGNVLAEDVVGRAEALQVFRNRYDVSETFEEGRRALRRLLELCPNYFLAFFFDPQNGNYTLVEKTANMRAETFSARDQRDVIVGYYYLLLSNCTDFHSVQRGGNLKVDCKGMGWSKRHAMKLMLRATSEALGLVPYTQCSAEFYNTGIAGVVHNMMRRAVFKVLAEPFGEEEWPAEKNFQYGLTYAEGLDSVLLVPDAATAQARTLRNMEDGLKLHFDNERKFRLGQENHKNICPVTDDMVDAISEARNG